MNPSLLCVSSCFSQCLLYRFDYIKFRFGHLYEGAYFYTHTMCPPPPIIYVSSYHGVLLVVQVWSHLYEDAYFDVCALC